MCDLDSRVAPVAAPPILSVSRRESFPFFMVRLPSVFEIGSAIAVCRCAVDDSSARIHETVTFLRGLAFGIRCIQCNSEVNGCQFAKLVKQTAKLRLATPDSAARPTLTGSSKRLQTGKCSTFREFGLYTCIQHVDVALRRRFCRAVSMLPVGVRPFSFFGLIGRSRESGLGAPY